MDGAVHVEGRGKRDHGTTVYDDDNFTRAHDLNKQLRIAANRMVRDGVDADNMIDLFIYSLFYDLITHDRISLLIYETDAEITHTRTVYHGSGNHMTSFLEHNPLRGAVIHDHTAVS